MGASCHLVGGSGLFFDTTSIYLERRAGEGLGGFGKNEDHRPDRHQMAVGGVLDEAGRPIRSELWPGNTTDLKTLLPVVDRLRNCFGLDELCIVGKRGMIGAETIRERTIHAAGLRWQAGPGWSPRLPDRQRPV